MTRPVNLSIILLFPLGIHKSKQPLRIQKPLSSKIRKQTSLLSGSLKTGEIQRGSKRYDTCFEGTNMI